MNRRCVVQPVVAMKTSEFYLHSAPVPHQKTHCRQGDRRPVRRRGASPEVNIRQQDVAEQYQVWLEELFC
jgi:hypothetical protein